MDSRESLKVNIVKRAIDQLKESDRSIAHDYFIGMESILSIASNHHIREGYVNDVIDKCMKKYKDIESAQNKPTVVDNQKTVLVVGSPMDQLRAKLAKTMQDVIDGNITVHQAKQVASLGNTLINSVRAEMEFKKMIGDNTNSKYLKGGD